MTPWGILRKFGKLLRGGARTPQIVLACVLGMIIGMVPGFNMTVVLAVLLLILLNANLALALPALALGKVLCISLAPVTFRIGCFVIHGMGLGGLFRAASETPILALMDLHYYCLTGGMPIAIVLGVAMGWAIARIINKARAAAAAVTGRSEKVQKIGKNIFVRIVLRIVFGKQKKSMEEILAARQPIIRKGRVILCLVLVGLVVVFEIVFLNSLAKRGLKGALELAVGAEVNIIDVDVSLFGGRFAMDGVQLTDAAKETHNSFQFITLASDISMSSLLAKRFVIEELTISGAKTDAKRKSPGYVLRKPDPRKPEITDDTISKYFKDGKKILAHLAKLQEYLEKREKAQQRQKAQEGKPAEGITPDEAEKRYREELDRLAQAHGYFKLNAKSVLARHPTVVIRKLKIEDIEIAGKKYTIEATELSDSPELNPHPMTLRVTNDEGFVAGVGFHFHDPAKPHEVEVVAPNIPLGKDSGLSDKVPLDISNGKVDAALKGRFSTRTMDLLVGLRVSGLESDATRGFLGLDPQTSQRIMKHLTKIDLTLGLQGPIGAPRVFVDDKQLITSMKQAMKDAAQAELAGALDGPLKKALEKVPFKPPKDIGKILPGGKLPGLLDNLLPGGDKPKKETPKEDDKDKEKEKKKPGLLDNLLK